LRPRQSAAGSIRLEIARVERVKGGQLSGRISDCECYEKGKSACRRGKRRKDRMSATGAAHRAKKTRLSHKQSIVQRPLAKRGGGRVGGKKKKKEDNN